MSEAEVKELKVAKVACQHSLLFHTRYFFKAQYKRKFVIGQHHQIICNALQRVIAGDCKRLIINIAPRYGKTELAVKSLISYGLALNPASKWIHLSYSDDLALDNSEAIKDLVMSEEYQQLFPEVQVKKDSRAKNKWYTTHGGGVLARAAGGSVTGFGAGQVDDPDFDGLPLFGGAIIIDDPIKPEDADSDTLRERVNSRFDSTIRNRANSRDTPIIVIMQRLHPNDLSGYLHRDGEQDDWEVISLPCLYHNEAGDLEALWPFKETVEELLSQQKANDIVFERQKQQNAKPKAGLLFPIDELNFYDPSLLEETLSDPDFCYIPTDPANLGGDDFASVVAKLIGDKIYITDMLYNTDGADFNEPALVKLILDNKASACGVESVMGWVETANRVRDELDEKGYEGEFRLLRPRTSKHSRIMNRASFIRNHFVFRKDYNENAQYAKFIRNLTSYLRIQEAGRGNKHDDAPDVCEMAAVYFEKNFPHLF